MQLLTESRGLQSFVLTLQIMKCNVLIIIGNCSLLTANIFNHKIEKFPITIIISAEND